MIMQSHWEKVYQTKTTEEVSWYQPTPATSLKFIQSLHLPLSASIIDVGGGDSLLVDHLLQLGYYNLTVLDISPTALARAQARLGEKGATVRWIVADVATFTPTQVYDVWHDRAAFHFLIELPQVTHYLSALVQGTHTDSALVLGTFSENGPTKCSGLPIRQYSEQGMTDYLSPHFTKVECTTEDHQTPTGNIQNFLFCHWNRQ